MNKSNNFMIVLDCTRLINGLPMSKSKELNKRLLSAKIALKELLLYLVNCVCYEK